MHCHTITEQDTNIKILSAEEILAVYTSHSVRHFPENERKPVSSIKRMAGEGIYTGYGLYLREAPASLLGYAFFAALPDKGGCLLDYFAVLEDYRSCGIGSLFLRKIKSILKGIPGFLIESEDPDYSGNAAEYAIRCKRLAFYEKNGAVFTGIRASVFSVPYRILFFPVKVFPPEACSPAKIPSAGAVRSDFCRIYRHMVSSEDYKTQICLR